MLAFSAPPSGARLAARPKYANARSRSSPFALALSVTAS